MSRDPNDDYLLVLAQAANADYLVSGEADLTSPTVRVVTPRQFIELLPSGGRDSD